MSLAWFGLMAGAAGYAQISPGELSYAHRSLRGSNHCTDCHDRHVRPPEFKCLECHKEIALRLKERKGLHASMVGKTADSRTCVKCHSEHNGQNFDLIHWDVPMARLDHSKTGYVLKGRHAGTDCRKCHQPSRIPQQARDGITVKNLTRTFLGLPDRCAGCHADAHQGQLSMECERCHTPDDWKRPLGFNHRQARYILDATHETVACAKCHPPLNAASPVVKYRGIAFDDCTPCHRDPHANAFGRTCKSCHDSRKEWKSSSASAVFRHSDTKFPLLGKHAGLPCDSCHAKGMFKQPIAFKNCSDCHKKDPHRGQFAARARRGECDECHTVQGFKPSSFDDEKHNSTRFALKERHLQIACSKCHVPAASGIIYRIPEFSCVSCHRDIHESQFAGEPYGNQCDRCHTQTTFKPSTYTLDRHSTSHFAISGGHLKATCGQCHKPLTTPVKYRFRDISCTACHEDPHKGEFAGRMQVIFSDGTPAGCRFCHTDNAWSELGRFDHTVSGFLLEGGHREVPCKKCHIATEGIGGRSSIHYTAASRECSGCHEDPHRGQFAGWMAKNTSDPKHQGCESCHTVRLWKELAGFNHSATKFPLEGGHKDVACAKCHPAAVPGGDTRTIRYADAPRECAGCHKDIHDGQFVSGGKAPDCLQCHKILKWIPSTFNHDTQSGYRLDGAHRNVACRLCHTNTRTVAGQSIVIYKPTAHECSACHSANNTGSEP